VWACEKFHRYIYGLSVRVLTDHKPLVPLINNTDLDKVPIRCQRLLMRLMRYSIHAEHVPGKDLVVADALSRGPLATQISYMEQEIEQHLEALRMEWPVSDHKLQVIRAETDNDPVLQKAIKYTLEGWPDKVAEVNPIVREFHSVRAHMSVAERLLLYDNRIVIPAVLRQDMLQRVHQGHQGITKCRERAATALWWPGIGRDIQNIVGSCEFCQVHNATQLREPLITTPLPEGPWEYIAMDLGKHNGKEFLVVVDYHSRYIEVAGMPRNPATRHVTNALDKMCATWGFPKCAISDNGPQFASREFEEYASKRGFKHVTSSPYHHQGNGEAERAVRTVKKMLDQKDPLMALLVYRTTPLYSTGLSPAQLIMSRQPRTNLPTLPRNQEVKAPDIAKVREKDEQYKQYTASHYNKHYNARPLPTLVPGDTARIKTDEQKLWSEPMKIVEAPASDQARRSYVVQTPQGNCYTRNRCHIQAIPEPQPEPSGSPMQGRSQDAPKTTPPNVDQAPVLRRSSRTPKPVDRLDL